MCAYTMTQLTTDETFEMPVTANMEVMAETFRKSKKDRKLEAFPMGPELLAKEQQKEREP